jgi:hypothetical protein
MSALQIAVCVVSFALVATKLLDCWSTADHLENPSEETNPLARRAMVRFGPRFTIWGIFSLVVVIVVVVGGSAYGTATDLLAETHPHPVKLLAVWGYVVLGLFISTVQAAVAQTNRSGLLNPVSLLVLHVTGWLTRR